MSVGARVPMLDAAARVRGTIGYTSNSEVPGAAVGCLVRARYPHARLRSIDTSAAGEAPGVLAVLTGAELRRNERLSPFLGPLTRDQPILAVDAVRYVGEPVAAIAAEDADAAHTMSTWTGPWRVVSPSPRAGFRSSSLQPARL